MYLQTLILFFYVPIVNNNEHLHGIRLFDGLGFINSTDLMMDRMLSILLTLKSCLFVCPLRTIFGNRKVAHVHFARRKHGNRDTELNMVCTQ